MFGLGGGEIAVILVIALIFIGPQKLPGLAKGIGRAVREFQNAIKGIGDVVQNPVKDFKDELKKEITNLPETKQTEIKLEDYLKDDSTKNTDDKNQ